jgi:hypothetical protein
MLGAFTAIRANWRKIVAALAIAAIVGLVVLDRVHVRQRDQARAAHAGEKYAHAITVSSYNAAASVAAKRDAQNLARVQAEQHAINERVTNEYQSRLADSVDRYERLRATAEAFARGGVTADVSAAREAACRAYAATSCDRLPAKLKAAQDNTDQLLALIAWAEAQGNVSVTVKEN